MTGDVYRPYHHVAPVTGRPTVFASLEYRTSEPPRAIEVDSSRWIRADLIPANVRMTIYDSLGLGR